MLSEKTESLYKLNAELSFGCSKKNKKKKVVQVE